MLPALVRNLLQSILQLKKKNKGPGGEMQMLPLAVVFFCDVWLLTKSAE